MLEQKLRCGAVVALLQPTDETPTSANNIMPDVAALAGLAPSLSENAEYAHARSHTT